MLETDRGFAGCSPQGTKNSHTHSLADTGRAEQRTAPVRRRTNGSVRKGSRELRAGGGVGIGIGVGVGIRQPKWAAAGRHSAGASQPPDMTHSTHATGSYPEAALFLTALASSVWCV